MKMRYKKFEKNFVHVKKFKSKMRYKTFFGENFIQGETISELKMRYKTFGENFTPVKKFLNQTTVL